MSSCNYEYRGARKESGKPPGEGAELDYWKRLAHHQDHELYHHCEALKAAKKQAKRKRNLLKGLMEMMVEDDLKKKARKENNSDKQCLCQTYMA